MRISTAALTLLAPVLSLLTLSASAQRQPMPYPGMSPKMELSTSFDFLRANAPPGVSDDFNLHGERFGAAYYFSARLAAVGEFSFGHANNIGPSGQNLSLSTYTFGPRLSMPHGRVQPFAEALFGRAHGSNSYFPTATGYTTSASSFAYSLGGGVDLPLTRQFTLRAVQAQYLHTALPNGSSDVQHHLQIGAGVVFRFGADRAYPR